MTDSLKLVKLLLNSILSTRKKARFACFDISNFYLGKPLDPPKYIRIQLYVIPQEFVDEYNLTQYNFEINKGIYGLK